MNVSVEHTKSKEKAYDPSAKAIQCRVVTTCRRCVSGQHTLVTCPVALRNDSPVKQSANAMAAGVGVMSKTGAYVNHEHTGEMNPALDPYHRVNRYLLNTQSCTSAKNWFPQHCKSAKPNSAHIESRVADTISQVK